MDWLKVVLAEPLESYMSVIGLQEIEEVGQRGVRINQVYLVQFKPLKMWQRIMSTSKKCFGAITTLLGSEARVLNHY